MSQLQLSNCNICKNQLFVLCIEPSSKLYKTTELSEVWKKVDQVLLCWALSSILLYNTVVMLHLICTTLPALLYKVEKLDENGFTVISFDVLSIATFFLQTQTLVLYCQFQFSCAMP